MPRFSLLSDWLAWLETLHPSAIDLGLDRVYAVAKKLNILYPSSAISHQYSGALAIPSCQTFMVAGTNGKGSCVTTIEQGLVAQGYSVGSYTSPHLHHYCERIRINGEVVEESLVCEAFAVIDQARGDISLTYFEFGTLAALWIFVQQQIPFVVLEVGLGGRLDAVNIVDADIAIVTSIDVDHEEWLGSDRETIAIEKLGISRATKPVIITEKNLTESLYGFIQARVMSGEPVSVIDQHFAMTAIDDQCQWQSDCRQSEVGMLLPLPALPLESVAAGLQALYLCDLLPEQSALNTMLTKMRLAGRYEVQQWQGRTVIFDVAHNPAAATMLARCLASRRLPDMGNTFAVFAAMNDKDVAAIVELLSPLIDHWYIGGLAHNQRAALPETLADVLQCATQPFTVSQTIEQSFEEALSASSEHDRIVVFGSFFTVAAVQQIETQFT